MQRMWCRQQDCADRGIGEDYLEVAGQEDATFVAKAPSGFQISLDSTRNLQARARLRGLDKGAAPAAKANNGAIDHVDAPLAARNRRMASMMAALSASGPARMMAAR